MPYLLHSAPILCCLCLHTSLGICRKHVIRKEAAAPQKQLVVSRHTRDQNTPANLPSAPHVIATPSHPHPPPHRQPLSDSASAAPLPLTQRQVAFPKARSPAAHTAAPSHSSTPGIGTERTAQILKTPTAAVEAAPATTSAESVSEASAASSSAGGGASMLRDTGHARVAPAGVQTSSAGVYVASQSHHSSSVPMPKSLHKHGWQHSTPQHSTQVQLTASSLSSAAGSQGKGVSGQQHACSASGLCSSSGSFGRGKSRQQTSHVRLPASTSSLDTAASSNAVAPEAETDGKLVTTGGADGACDQADSASRPTAEFTTRTGPASGAGLFGDAPGRDTGPVQNRAAKPRSGLGRAGKQARSKGPSPEVGITALQCMLQVKLLIILGLY